MPHPSLIKFTWFELGWFKINGEGLRDRFNLGEPRGEVWGEFFAEPAREELRLDVRGDIRPDLNGYMNLHYNFNGCILIIWTHIKVEIIKWTHLTGEGWGELWPLPGEQPNWGDWIEGELPLEEERERERARRVGFVVGVVHVVLLADDSTVVCVIIHEEEIVGGAEGGRQTEEIGGRGNGKLCRELELLCKQKTSKYMYA